MQTALGLLYALLFLTYVATALFIVFHILRYSLSRRMAVFATVLFLGVLTVLLLTNALIFFSLPFDTFIPKNYGTGF